MANSNRSKHRLPDPKHDKDVEPSYPYNIVDVWPSWRREIDSTPGKERYFEGHKSGSYRKVGSGGQITEMNVTNKHEYTKNSSIVTIDGFTDMITKGTKMVVKGGKLMEFGGDLDFHVLGGMHMVVAKNFKVTAKNMTMSAQKNIYHDANQGTFKSLSGGDMIQSTKSNHIMNVDKDKTLVVKNNNSEDVGGDRTIKIAKNDTSKVGQVRRIKAALLKISQPVVMET